MNIKTSFLKKEHIDSGLALMLITLLFGLWLNPQVGIRMAIAELIVILIAPAVLYPFTFLWLNLSELLGIIMSRVLLTLIFIVFVCPVGLIRKALGKDTLLLKSFKKEEASVFTERNHSYTKSDFTAQY
ncbi:MAG: SxtJ family membrane protein [Methylococcaceae bacterium]